MHSCVRVQTTVLPGSRVEVTAPGLPEGQPVEVVLLFDRPCDAPQRGILDFLDSLPTGPRSAKTWDELEAGLQREREAWGP